ncbi:MAG TPA: prenyltransferase, partial [Rhodocyclaceae bacterium]|nr:prenyltransferase [Rhodocyclaceae bacterium]
VFPFTGGSRFIQNDVLSLRETRNFGYVLLAAVIPAGLWLTWHSALGLIPIGLLGLLTAWAYSAPPLKLMSRGMGEGAITAGWLLVVLGTDFVQRGEFSSLPLVAGLPFALLVAAILYINQFPDARADASAGKRTLVVRLGPVKASWGYVTLVVAAYGWLAFAIVTGRLPGWAAIGLVPLVFSIGACRQLLANAAQPSRLAPGIKLTILAANLNGLLLSVGLALSRSF